MVFKLCIRYVYISRRSGLFILHTQTRFPPIQYMFVTFGGPNV